MNETGEEAPATVVAMAFGKARPPRFTCLGRSFRPDLGWASRGRAMQALDREQVPAEAGDGFPEPLVLARALDVVARVARELRGGEAQEDRRAEACWVRGWSVRP